MDWKHVVAQWRKLPVSEQRRVGRARIPRKIARSMAFEGEPVDQKMLEAEFNRRTRPSVS
jgi:hypothetical protein